MKRYIYSREDIFGMSNLSPRKTNLPVIIWTDHSGVDRAAPHRNSPRVKLTNGEHSMSISIEEDPKILAESQDIPENVKKEMKKGIEYVARNYDIFLKHYLDTDFSFDDDDLKDALRERGDYK